MAAVLAIPAILEAEDQCVACHVELDDELAAPVEQFKTDVHSAAGLGCADCHGGDPTSDDPDESMDPKKGFHGKLDPLDVPKYCARCHSDAMYMKQYNPGLPIDQYDKYRSSVHGERNAKGDKKVAQCASCHVPHDMKPANDPTSGVYALNIPGTCAKCHADEEYMAPYGIKADQYARYETSVHGQALLVEHDLGAPACNDCHGNHGASPPLMGSIPNVCGNCHAFNADLFAQSPHRAAFKEQDIPACETCHGVHDITMLGTENLGDGDQSICLDCHDADDGTSGIATAVAMQGNLTRLEEGYHHADSLLAVAERKGMFVEEARYNLKDVRQQTIQAHTLVHSFDDSVVQTKVDSGMLVLAGVTEAAHEKLAESAFRRWGLLISTLIISFVAVLLYLKIRQLES